MTSRARPLVLLLDDDERWLRSLRRVLVRQQLEVDAFTSAVPLLAKLDACDAGLVILDYMLPDTTGADVARAIRGACPRPPPLVLLSSTLDSVSQAERALFEAALDKGIPLAELVSELVSRVRATTKSSGFLLRAEVAKEMERNGKGNGDRQK